ncbi:hypothetical protein B0A48_00732 [Cryoendolithus antarcticus]|uniref:PhoD-like phosphatase metallophosphatase domain-containing protein n=1 Tax=Cryoendolithus antarcticus TaxID=1507870 RepID=A0A1V8TR83_9PEZI|nr:hypothetical protein B0A48_00732 [Cryoendolithus antarcticus]
MGGDELNQVAKYVTLISSLGLRAGAYVFLRWIPGHHLPPSIYAFLAVYVTSFVYNLIHTEPYRVISDEIDVVARESTGEDDGDRAPSDSVKIGAVAEGEPELDLDVEETIIVEENEPQVVQTLLTGLPSPSSLLWSGLTFAINLAAVLMVLDLVYRGPTFHPAHDLSLARVGYVSDRDAKLLVREPDASKYPVSASYRYADSPVSMGSRPDGTWKSAGQLAWLDNSTDFTGTLELTRLKPDTRYQWHLSSNHSGHFTTAPAVGSLSGRFGTEGVFTFVHSSCLKNNFPYRPFRHALSNPGLKHLSAALLGLKAQFMLFLGDFIYIDVPRRPGVMAEDYRREYRQTYASPDWTAAARELPWIHVYDDHEVANDWDKNTTGVFEAAFDPYRNYHISVNPPAVRPGESWFSFVQGPASFFMLDTRRYRAPNDNTNGSDPITGAPTKSLLGEHQLADLLSWLKRREPSGVRWKILVSSIPFTKNWWFGAQDTWRGYLGERQIILEAMWDVGLEGGVGVVVLSGDRHEFAATAFPPPPDGKEEIVGLGPLPPIANPFGLKGSVIEPDVSNLQTLRTRRKRWPLSATVHEFSASPLSMFYLPYRTYKESSTSPDYISDVCIKYIPDGNSKFGAVSISNPTTSDQSILHYRLFVDGVEKWSYTITTPPDVTGSARSKDAIWG